MIPDLLDVQLNHSLHGRFDDGWKVCQRLLQERFWCNRTKFNAGWYLLRQGKLKEGMELINCGRFEQVFGSGHIGSKMPIYDGSKLHGENVLFHCEGGLGDEIIGMHFVKEIANRGGSVVVACDKSLAPLFSRVQGANQVINRIGCASHPHSFWVPGMSAEYILNHTFETIPKQPYLTPHEFYVNRFATIIRSSKFRVGIKWAGNPEFEHEQHRLFPTEHIFNLVKKFDNVQFYSLQLDRKEELPEEVYDLAPHLNTWEDTAGAMQHLDLVISSCTSVAHLSAALGRRTWIIVPILSYYVWAFPGEKDSIFGEKTWYYDTARLFRQEEYGTWMHPFSKIETALESIC